MSKKVHDMRGNGTGKVQFEYFPQPIIDLTRELAHPFHKELRDKYNSYDFVDQLKGLCTEVGIILDGMYDGNDAVAIAEKITNKLIERRGGLIVVNKL